MIYAGKDIQSSSDKLVKVPIAHVYSSLKHPSDSLCMAIRQLRAVRDLDAKRYAVLKKQLPYFVCGCFNPPYRRKENFAFIQYFVLDIDHLSQKNVDIHEVKERLKQDKRIVLMFRSPGEDGLKLMFELKERCYDAGVYSLFYKIFVKRFPMMHGLEQVVDTVTSDVTRACFMSMDDEAYYNADAEKVVMDDYVNTDNSLEMFDMKKAFDKEEKKNGREERDGADSLEMEGAKDPDKDTLNHIKDVLNQRKKTVQQEVKCVYVPEQLEMIINGLKTFIEDQGIDVYEIVNIQYAKKIRCKLGMKKAELNLFYGKHGFRPVVSPKTGTSEELNAVVEEIVNIYLSEL